MVWCILPAGAARADVNKKGGGGEGIRAEARGHICMEQECTNTIVESAKYAFSTTILLRGVWTGEMEDGAVGGKEGVYGASELGGDVGEEGGEGGGDVRFTAKGKSPHKMRIVIQ